MHQIRREKRPTISQVIVRVKRNIKQNRNWFYFKFSVQIKARVSYLTILKRKSLSLPSKVETGQFVISLVLPECLSVKICCISPSDSEANRNGDGRSPLPLFFPFSTSFKNECQTTRPNSSKDWGRIVQRLGANCPDTFKNSSPRGNVRKLSLFWDWWAESLFVLIIVANITMAASSKKKFLAKQFARAINLHY